MTSGACASPSDTITQQNTYNAANELTNIFDREGSTTTMNLAYGRAAPTAS